MNNRCDPMKFQTLAVFLASVMVISATLPSISLCLDSSVTSYNNTTSYNTGDIEIDSSNRDFDVFKVEDDVFGQNEAYEIASSDDGFIGSDGTKKVSFSIPANKKFVINVKLDTSWMITSGFKIHIECGNKVIVDEATLYGGSLTNNPKQGYLHGDTEGNNWYLNKDISGAKVFESESDDFSIEVTGTERFVRIHLYIVFLEEDGMG